MTPTDADLDALAAGLAEGDSATLEHQTRPGSLVPALIDDMLRWVGPRAEPRAFLESLIAAARPLDAIWCAALLERLEALVADPAGLTPPGEEGELFVDTCRRLAARGLAFAADLEPVRDLGPEALAFIERQARDTLDREQYIDLFANRRRRRSLVRRAPSAAAPPAAAADETFAYDVVHYPGRAHRYTSPAEVEVIARIFGLDAVPAVRARVLEVGCATGLNLLPMAERWPEARFVGLDLSRSQIETGRELAAAAGLDNVELLHLDLCDLDASRGPFDLIVAHGFYSWVPEHVRARLLAVCAEQLSPAGIGWISFDVKPGCVAKAVSRDLMLHHTRAVTAAGERIAQARAFLARVAEANGRRDRLFAALLSRTLATSEPDDFFYHEHLAPISQGFFFHEFAARLEAHGLDYLADADVQSMLPLDLAPEALATVERLARDEREREQLLDLVRNRPFREAVICRGGRAPRRDLAGARLADLWVAAAAPDDTSLPAELTRRWPAPLPAAQLGLADDALRALFSRRRVELYPGPPPFTIAPPERPRAGAFARLMATRGDVVTSLRHANVQLGDLDRRLLAALDGRRDLAELRRATGLNAKALTRALERLARLALIMA